MVSATGILSKVAGLIGERGRQYDKKEGRSMGRAVSAFNAITGKNILEEEGYLLLQILKDVRQWQNPDNAHVDSLEDSVAYAALKAEAFINNRGE